MICSIQEPEIKQVATEQYMIMQNHVKVMVALMDPSQNQMIGIQDLHKWEPVQFYCQGISIGMTPESILTILKTSAGTMANKNFNSGLRMKAGNVRHIHIHMALQQMKILNRYMEVMNKFMKDRAPESSREKQVQTYETFKKLFKL